MLRTIASGLVLVVAAVALGGCSSAEADASDGTTQHIQTKPTSLFVAKLYDQPHAQPDDFCDKYTELTLTKTAGGFEARLENKLSATSACEIMVQPNARTFSVKGTEDCGSDIYVGNGPSGSIEIQDHRSRLCEDLRADTLEVETSVNGKRVVLYGSAEHITSGNAEPPANATCSSGGKTYKPGQSFTDADGCNTCTCGNDGSILCTETFCGNGGGGTCTSGGKTYKPGDSFPDADGCNTCTCGNDGSVGCTEMFCQ